MSFDTMNAKSHINQQQKAFRKVDDRFMKQTVCNFNISILENELLKPKI